MLGALQVLVADDAVEVASRTGRVLEESGLVKVLGPALDGAEALRLYEKQRPAAAVLDLFMPGFTGLEVLRSIRTSDAKCVVVILTGADEPSVREACLAAGADFVLSKSRDLHRIASVVLNALGLVSGNP
jgi:CheY-like chemotaxis protein